MHPIVFSELHQSKRGLPWALLVLFSASALLQSFVGLPAVFLFLSPSAAAAIGVGTLAEEYSKGQLRFFYSMPISPLGLWSVKVLSGIVGTSLFVAVVWLPALFIHRPLIEIPGSDELGLLIGRLVPVLAGQAILAYAAGLFCIGFCQVTRTAILLATLISIIPFLVYALIAVDRGLVLPSANDLGLGLAVASLPLWIGAYVLFRCRNPFVDQPWRWRGVAAVFGGFHVLAVIGVAYALTMHPVELTDPYRDGVYYFSVFADDSKVFVLGRRGLWDVEAYVLDSDGRLARHLFHADQAHYLMPERWREGTDSPLMLCRQENVSLRSADGPAKLFLVDLETGAKTPVNELSRSDRSESYQYSRPSHDGRYLFGLKEVRRGDRSTYSAFRQDIITSDFRETPILEGQRYATCQYLDDHRVLVADLGSDKPAERKLTLIDLESGTRTPRPLPADVRHTFLAPDGGTCAAHLWTFQGDTIRQQLAVLDVAIGAWKTILTAEDLPHFTMKEALTSRYPVVMVSYPDRHGTGWMICTVEHPGAAETRLLINIQTGARFKLPEKDQGQISRFSKDGAQFFTLSFIENEREQGRDQHDRLVSVYRLKNSSVQFVNSFRWEENRLKPEWLGNERLIYRKPVSNERLLHKRIELGLHDRGELWTVDVQTGQERPFFAGNDSVVGH
jgi:hypothetical protein